MRDDRKLSVSVPISCAFYFVQHRLFGTSTEPDGILEMNSKDSCELSRRRSHLKNLLCGTEGSAILEFAIVLPLLVVFIVGIYDFSGAFNQKQKMEQAVQEGAIIAGAQPANDIETGNPNPDSVQPVVTTVFNSLTGSGVILKGACNPPGAVSRPGSTALTWVYTITGCSSSNPTDNLIITINRGWAGAASGTVSVGASVRVQYPYHWRFNSVIQLLIPGASYLAITDLNESATIHSQM